jgi:hypothetical protein
MTGGQNGNTVPKSVDASFDPPLIRDALLAYVIGHNAPLVARKKAVLGYFPTDAIVQAKHKLWDIYPEELGLYPKRNGSNKTSKSEMHLNDICDALETLDSAQKMPDVVVPASVIGAMPPSPKEISPTLALLDRISAIEAEMQRTSSVEATLSQISQGFEALNERVRTLERWQYERSTYSSAVARPSSAFPAMPRTVAPPQRLPPPPTQRPPQAERMAQQQATAAVRPREDREASAPSENGWE